MFGGLVRSREHQAGGIRGHEEIGAQVFASFHQGIGNGGGITLLDQGFEGGLIPQGSNRQLELAQPVGLKRIPDPA